jgi:hypothetical protein
MKIRGWGAAAALGAALLAGCSGMDGLSGTTWLGGNIMDSDVSLAFASGGSCQLKTSFMGSGACTWKSDDDEVLVTFGGKTYAFVRADNQLVGNLFGAGVSLVRQ